MIKILKNNTATAITIDVGDTVPANGQLTIGPHDYDEYAASDEIITLIGDESITVNNGNRDLNISEGVRLILGGLTDKLQFHNDLITSGDRLKVSIETDSTTVDHGLLIGLSDDDHPQYLNETRGDIRYYTKNETDTEIDNNVAAHANLTNNPHSVTASQVGLGNVNNTADIDKPVSTAVQSELDGKYDASNPNGYETPLQLSNRDNANRDRSNHTGTQLASTISDFSNQVSLDETTTSISFNSANSTLTYLDEDNQSTQIDLSMFLDNTDLTVVSGTLNSATGIVTFTRNDSSTFTIDMSSLSNDQQASGVTVTPTGNLTSINAQAALEELQQEIDSIQTSQSNQNNAISLNTSKVSADGSIGTHSDVDVTTNSPSIGDVLTYDGTNFIPATAATGTSVFGSDAESSESTVTFNVSGTSYITYDSLTFTVTETTGVNRYRLNTDFLWKLNTTTSDIQAALVLDGVRIKEIKIEPKDTGSDQRIQNNVLKYVDNLSTGTHTIELQFRPSLSSRTVTIYENILEVWRTK